MKMSEHNTGLLFACISDPIQELRLALRKEAERKGEPADEELCSRLFDLQLDQWKAISAQLKLDRN